MKELRETENMMRHIIHNKLRGTMTPQDNVLYFPQNIDIRLCPKNGITTLKWALWHVYKINVEDDPEFAANCGTKGHRLKEIKEKGESTILRGEVTLIVLLLYVIRLNDFCLLQSI